MTTTTDTQDTPSTTYLSGRIETKKPKKSKKSKNKDGSPEIQIKRRKKNSNDNIPNRIVRTYPELEAENYQKSPEN